MPFPKPALLDVLAPEICCGHMVCQTWTSVYTVCLAYESIGGFLIPGAGLPYWDKFVYTLLKSGNNLSHRLCTSVVARLHCMSSRWKSLMDCLSWSQLAFLYSGMLRGTCLTPRRRGHHLLKHAITQSFKALPVEGWMTTFRFRLEVLPVNFWEIEVSQKPDS